MNIATWNLDKEKFDRSDSDEVNLHRIVKIKQSTNHYTNEDGTKFKVKTFTLINADGEKFHLKAFT